MHAARPPTASREPASAVPVESCVERFFQNDGDLHRGLGEVASRPRAVPSDERMRALPRFRVRVRVGPWLGLALLFAWPGCGGKSSAVPHSAPVSAGTSGASSGASAGAGGTDSDRPLQPGECKGNEDCGNALSCVEPGGEPPGGLCMPANCSDDSDCRTDGGNAICEPRPRNCGSGNTCKRGCAADGDCSVGQSCKSSRCVQEPCAKDPDCPPDFACSAGSCERKGCAFDSSCSAYCVKGSCYSTPGSCEQGRP